MAGPRLMELSRIPRESIESEGPSPGEEKELGVSGLNVDTGGMGSPVWSCDKDILGKKPGCNIMQNLSLSEKAAKEGLVHK